MKNKFQLTKYILVSIIVLYSCLSAEENKKLTLDESIKIGLENSEEINSARWKITYADAKLTEINASRLPNLSLNAGYTRLSPITPYTISTPFGEFELNQNIVNNYGVKLTLRQPLFTGFRLKANSDIAEYNLESFKADFNRDKNDLILNIKKAYWNLYKANEVKKVVDENVEQNKAHLKDVKNFYEHGLATKNELLKVQVQLADTKLKQIDANNAVRLAKINLNNIIGMPLSTEISLADTVNPTENYNEDLDYLVNKAYENRPELKSMDYKIKASESLITVAQSSWFPQIYLSGDYNYARPNSRIFPVQDKFNGTWDINISASFNLWNWGATSAQTTQAEANLEQVKDALKTLKDNITLEITNNYLTMMRSKETISVANDNVEQAEENYRVTNQQYKNGLTLNSELLDAEVALLQAKTNYVQSLVDYKLAVARLEKSVSK